MDQNSLPSLKQIAWDVYVEIRQSRARIAHSAGQMLSGAKLNGLDHVALCCDEADDIRDEVSRLPDACIILTPDGKATVILAKRDVIAEVGCIIDLREPVAPPLPPAAYSMPAPNPPAGCDAIDLDMRDAVEEVDHLPPAALVANGFYRL